MGNWNSQKRPEEGGWIGREAAGFCCCCIFSKTFENFLTKKWKMKMLFFEILKMRNLGTWKIYQRKYTNIRKMYFTHGKLKSWITINCIEWFHEMVNWYLNGKLKSYDQGKLNSCWKFNSKLKSWLKLLWSSAQKLFMRS